MDTGGGGGGVISDTQKQIMNFYDLPISFRGHISHKF